MLYHHQKTCFHTFAYRLLALAMILVFLTGTCSCSRSASERENKAFRSFTLDCFKELVSRDSIRLHFTLSDPGQYGISQAGPASDSGSAEADKKSSSSRSGSAPKAGPSFQHISADAQKEETRLADRMLGRLSSFDRDKLSEENRQTYDIFEAKLRQTVASGDYIFYSSFLGSGGLPSQIPVSLSEYYFHNEEDVKNYLALMTRIPDLFDEMLQFEQDRLEAGFDLPDFTIKNTIDQIDHFLSGNEEDHLLLTSFSDRISTVEGLSKDQKDTYISNNRALFEQVVIPAYQSLKKELAGWRTRQEAENPQRQAANTLTGSAENPQRLAANALTKSAQSSSQQEQTGDSRKERLSQYAKGKDYYKLLLKSRTGTDKSPEACQTYLEKKLDDLLADIASLNADKEDLYTDYLAARPAITDYQKILALLQEDMAAAFPPLSGVKCNLKPLPASLSGTHAAAFYLIPPIDSADSNIIYVNEDRVNDIALFSTLAHEGYPGHLYQTNYYQRKEPDPLRHLLKTEGYDEGWGTYAQIFSYQFMDFADTDEETRDALRRLCRDNDLISLTLSSLSDLYVNYLDYDRETLAEKLADYGIQAESAGQIYEYVVENPVTWLNYCMGYYELEEIKEDYMKKAGDAASLMEFHKKVLDCGSCPYELLRAALLDE